MKTTTYIRIGRADPVLWDSLNDKEKENCKKQFANNISSNVSDLVTNKITNGEIDSSLEHFLKTAH
ncbi:MAG: hypothetical protein IJY88_01495 [Clostridia bacterium]|nr:hypothetical protein [Clostridia bacterium]